MWWGQAQGPHCFKGLTKTFAFLLNSGEKNEFWVQENVLVYNTNIFVFIATQWEDTIFNLIFMEERSHESKRVGAHEGCNEVLCEVLGRGSVSSQGLYRHLGVGRSPREVSHLPEPYVCLPSLIP